MTQPLQIQFRIPLNDWLEFRGKEQSSFKLWLLQIADIAWLPLLVLLAVTVLIASLTLSKAVNIALPAWLPLPVLFLLALCRIYISVPSIKATLLAKKEWKRKMADVSCTVELTETGFQYVAGTSIYQPTWAEINSVFQSERLLIFCDDDDEYALFIPKRAFVSEKQLQEFLKLAYQKTVLDRKAGGSRSAEQALGADSP